MPDKNWLSKYESIKEQLYSKIDLESYFTEKQIGKVAIDTLEIGTVHFPTGTVVACDPCIELEDALPYLQQIPAGTYPVTICVVPSEKYGDRYACVKVAVSSRKPVRYELGMTGTEDLEEELEEDEFFGFGVDAGMGCIIDQKTQEEYKKYWEKRCEEEKDVNLFDDLFDELLIESAKAHPKYQEEYGDWAVWTIPGTDCNVPIFHSGWGDGAYPCYFGYDENNAVCGVYIRFIDIAADYED